MIKKKAIWIVLSTTTTPGKAYDVEMKNGIFWHINDNGDYVPSEPSSWSLIEPEDELKFNHPV